MWNSAPQMPGYQLTKSSCTCVLQEIARDVPADQLQILSFHPSFVFTEAAQTSGYTKDTLPWTDGESPNRTFSTNPVISFHRLHFECQRECKVVAYVAD